MTTSLFGIEYHPFRRCHGPQFRYKHNALRYLYTIDYKEQESDFIAENMIDIHVHPVETISLQHKGKNPPYFLPYLKFYNGFHYDYRYITSLESGRAVILPGRFILPKGSYSRELPNGVTGTQVHQIYLYAYIHGRLEGKI